MKTYKTISKGIEETNVGNKFKVKGEAGHGIYRRLDGRSKRAKQREKHGKNPLAFCEESKVLR